MALLHGKGGNIKWDASASRQTINHIQSWTVDATHDVAEITGMQDSFKTYAGGFNDWTATAEALLPKAGVDIDFATGNPNGMGDVSAKVEFYLEWDAGGSPSYISLYGSAICTGISPGADKDGAATVTYTFQGTGTLAWDNDTSLLTY